MTEFSTRIARLLKQRNLTQKELANRAGVTESAMSYYIKGDRTPSGDILVRIATALNTTTDYLLGHDAPVHGDDRLHVLQRNLQKLDPNELKKAESVLNAVFEDIFNAKFDDDDGED